MTKERRWMESLVIFRKDLGTEQAGRELLLAALLEPTSRATTIFVPTPSSTSVFSSSSVPLILGIAIPLVIIMLVITCICSKRTRQPKFKDGTIPGQMMYASPPNSGVGPSGLQSTAPQNPALYPTYPATPSNAHPQVSQYSYPSAPSTASVNDASTPSTMYNTSSNSSGKMYAYPPVYEIPKQQLYPTPESNESYDNKAEMNRRPTEGYRYAVMESGKAAEATDAPPSAIPDPPWTNFPSLTALSLGINGLLGPIPESLWRVPNLRDLWLNSNQIEGKHMIALVVIKMVAQLTESIGPIPSAISNASVLAYIHLDSNRFTGTIPASLGQLRNLVTLDLSNNQLVGGIPESIGRCRAKVRIRVKIRVELGFKVRVRTKVKVK
ncbi:hypothetical protein HDV05_001294, partial [Chytridiales sp. JEL 0842]